MGLGWVRRVLGVGVGEVEVGDEVVVADDVGLVGLKAVGIVAVVGDVEIVGGDVVEFAVVEMEDDSEVEVVDWEFVGRNFG